MNMTRQKHKDYRLNHWELVYIGDRIAASGNLHDRPEYPEGAEIQTSVVSSWDLSGDDVLLFTLNSIYRCPLAEYISSSGSLILLDEIDSCSDITVDQLSKRAADLFNRELRSLRKMLQSYSSDSCVLFRWEGCDAPYLKKVITYECGNINIDDLSYSRAEYSCDIALSNSLSMKVNSTQLCSRHFYRYNVGKSLTLVENTGNKEIFVTLHGQHQICVPAGMIVRAD